MTDPYEPYQGRPPALPPAPPPVSPLPPTLPMPASYPVSGPPPYLPVPYPPPAAQVFSDKSKIVAGLLQVLLGFFFTLGGIGRLYAGNTTLGITQVIASVVAWTAFWCGWFVFFLSWPIWIAAWLWFVIDGFVILVGRPVDGQGRLLRS